MKHTIYADLDTMVFEGREKNYGAYHMRRRYQRMLSRSMMIAFLLFLSVTGLPKVIAWISPGEAGLAIDEPDFAMTEPIELPPIVEEPIEEIPELPKEPKMPEEPTPEQVASIDFNRIEPSPDADPDASLLDVDTVLELDTAIISNVTQDGEAWDNTMLDILDDFEKGRGGGGDPELTVVEPDPLPDDFFIGEEPKPIDLDGWRQSVGYPPMAVEAGIQGKVIVRVLVDKLGNYMRHIVLRDAHPILSKRVGSKLKDLQFTPGIQGNKPVKVWVTLPIDFVLQN